jgi:hypothetical protein
VARTFADAVRLGRDHCMDSPLAVVSVTRPGAIYAGQARTLGDHTLLVRFAFVEAGQYVPAGEDRRDQSDEVAHLLTSAIFWGAQQARAEIEGGSAATAWRALLVTDSAGDEWGPLGGIVDRAPANMDTARLGAGGEIVEWAGFFMAAPGESPDWDTPRGPVDWSGLREALGREGGAL